MKVRDVMTSPVATVRPEDSYKTTITFMLRLGVSSLAVTDSVGRLVGVVSEADLVAKEAFIGERSTTMSVLTEILFGGPIEWVEKAKGVTAGDVMTRDVDTAGPGEGLTHVARRMVLNKRKHLPVVEDGKVVGMLSRSDILALFTRPDRAIRADIAAHLTNPLWCPEDAHVDVEVIDGVAIAHGEVLHPMDRAVVESAIWAVPGVVALRVHLTAREPDPAAS